MKKNLLYLGFCCCLLSMLQIGCDGKVEESTTAGVSIGMYGIWQQTEIFMEGININKKNIEEVIPAYEKYIADELGINEYAVYNLIYIDNDNIPELLFDNTADGRGTEVLSYKDEQVYSSSACCRGFDFYYIPKENRVIYSSIYTGEVQETIAHMENGILVEDYTCYFYFDDNMEDCKIYDADGNQCTETEYDDFKNTYIPYENTEEGWITYSSIQEAYEALTQ